MLDHIVMTNFVLMCLQIKDFQQWLELVSKTKKSIWDRTNIYIAKPIFEKNVSKQIFIVNFGLGSISTLPLNRNLAYVFSYYYSYI